MKRSFVALLLIGLLGMTACTDAQKANLIAYGSKHRITMYNGGQLVREWTSTGKVSSIDNSDGWQFMDSKTKRLVRVGGDVIIEVID